MAGKIRGTRKVTAPANIAISIIVLNWNREALLRGTVLSLLATTRQQFELIIIDNASTDGSVNWLQLLKVRYPNIDLILLKSNKGGEALNLGLQKAKGRFILISENDLEYSPGWDDHMLRCFQIFPELGQLSPLSPYPRRDIGENWVDKPATLRTRRGVSVYIAGDNVGTSCMIRREVFEKGVRWHNIRSSKNNFRFPADGPFSRDVRKAGFEVAWCDEYQVINWGHMEITWKANQSYYDANWEAKSEFNIDGLRDYKSGTSHLQPEDLQIAYSKLLQEFHALKTEKNIVTTQDLERELAALRATLQFRVGSLILAPFKPLLVLGRKSLKLMRILKNRNRGVK